MNVPSTHVVGHCGLCDGYRCLVRTDEDFGEICTTCAGELDRIEAIMKEEPK